MAGKDEDRQAGRKADYAAHGKHANKIYDKIASRYGIGEDNTDWSGNRSGITHELSAYYAGNPLIYAKEGEDIGNEIIRYTGEALEGQHDGVMSIIGKPVNKTADIRQKIPDTKTDPAKARRKAGE